MNRIRITPKMNLSERHSIKGMAKSRGISINEFKKQIIREEKNKSMTSFKNTLAKGILWNKLN